MVQTISSQLYDPVPSDDPLLKIQLTVTISSNDNYAFGRYSNEKGDFFSVNPKSHVTIRYLPKDKPWDKHQQITINQKNIYQLRLGLRKFYTKFQRENLYTYDETGRIESLIPYEDDVVRIPLGMMQILRLSPTIIRDRKNVLYAGVTLTVNREENQVDLTVDEFEGIYDLFANINIYQSGLTLLQTYIGMRKNSVEDTMDNMKARKAPVTKEYKGSGSLFDQSVSKEVMKSPVKWDVPQSLDGLKM